MHIRELAVSHSFEIRPTPFGDERGVFVEWFREDAIEAALKRRFPVRQANISVSARGVVRGIHFADVPPSQAKFVTAVHGAVLDFVVDIRVGSPTFGKWDSVRLDDTLHNAVFLAEGLGHCFVALSDHATVSYLISEPYNPAREHGISPFDDDIALDLPFDRSELLLSAKDREAPSLSEARKVGLLPTWEDAQELYARAAIPGVS
ncbi:dTDP-4-dehydrorhamnose 3,5-epimerase family protein [Paramicrobacterium fandaimingii]|uniref:dTDP-4-dehydrorhamnose 3,5-epimerase family protein n=1 Tax=Paramicrobacterium fandaimingii TaxID=2708079 RepID=UPI001420EBD1|nr:dTDP-4-dehydrorhamnose 3,5-epimerase [Microbacterium fandaimingii]